MYPRRFFDTLWRSDLRDDAFVAMPFGDEFDPVWREVFRPAVEQARPRALQAKRVDVSVLSGDVVTAILDGIAHSRLVLADISVMSTGRWAGQRNGNVMYEVGLAHAIRLEPEVLMVRSDDEPLNFDVAGVQVHRYRREDLSDSRAMVTRLLTAALSEIDLSRSLAVERAVEALDADSVDYLVRFGGGERFTGPRPKTMGEHLLAISNRAALARLQTLGIIRGTLPLNSAESGSHVFVWTEFGRAVMHRLGIGAATG